ncbi:DUF3108 domain-containing protein [Ulvibacter antarcticus]|uniref:Uncharacterized protein DUF3108 n=1 Tax=Ulvibacter antarcticus TaxID=442714 RepID=A0A3L9Z642_9FLAO|nr:DUF3108 domain-containing protein [Ulvibacter antarcticus]RMA65848.1 uncharacterized protein DUF3108 [Ulvibacter antarcticus]
MKKLIIIILLLNMTVLSAQNRAFGDGEKFKFRVHYGLVTAGYATLEVKNASLKGEEVFHIKGFGETTGISKFFFKVEDNYQSYVDKKTDVPYRFIRKIDEGGYTKDIQIDFDYNRNVAVVNNKKHNTVEDISLPMDPQDMVSAFYYLRNHIDIKTIKEGDVVDMNMFFDRGTHKFRLKFLGRETLKTNFGKVPCLIFRPYVEAGRVFKEKESLTVWVTDDENKMPLLIQADLAVGSLKATLTEYRGLKHQFKIIPD